MEVEAAGFSVAMSAARTSGANDDQASRIEDDNTGDADVFVSSLRIQKKRIQELAPYKTPQG